MLSMIVIKSNAGDAGGMPAYLKQSEYYLDKNGVEQSSSAWYGKGAAALGLIGKPVTEELMDKLADGFSPTDEKLRQNAGRKPEFRPTLDRDGKQRIDDKGKPMGAWVAERVGYDLCFSPPKSFSIIFAAADPELRDRMLDCHHKAVKAGLRIMEMHAAETRRGKGSKDVIEVDGLLVSIHTHFAARSHDKTDGVQGTGIDMQVHSHALVYNSVLADGSWSSLDASGMFDWKKAAGAAYRAELATDMKTVGFGIEDDIRLDDNGMVKDRFFKISGVPDELIKERSGRRKQIEAFMSENPEASAQQATMATRAGKDEPSFGELVNSIWKDELAEWRTKNPGQFPENMRDLLNREPTREQLQEQKREAKRTQQDRDKEILAELHETKSVWSRKDLTQSIAERSAGK
jgi:conjugative relaxase-like TrwC/TraI family protein